MEKELRNSGIDIIGDVPWGTHICQFYQTKKELMEILLTYFKAGLENNEFCIWVTSEPVEVEDAIKALRKAIPGFDTYLEKGQIEILPYIDWFITEGIFDPVRVSKSRLEKLNHALDSGYDGMRLSGNTTWLDKESWNSFIRFKEQTDRVMDTYRMVNLCTYLLDKHNAAEIIDVVSNHQFALIKREGKWECIESPKRKRAEESLREGEELLHFALEISRTGAWNLDLVDHTAYRSLEHDRIFGYEQLLPEWTYEMFLDHVLPEDRAMVDAKFREATNTLSDWSFECRIRRVDGEVRWIWAAGRHRVNATGSARRMAGIVQDITERKQLEEQTRQRAEEIATVMEVAPVAIWIGHDPQCYNITGNQMANEFYEAEVGENVSANVSPVRRFFRKGHELTADELPMQESALKDIDVRNVEFDVLLPSGEWRGLLGSASPLHDPDGRVRGSVGTFIDITERKRVEEALKEAYHSLEENVKERTAELKEAYNSLMENDRRLSEAQKMAHIGNWDWNIITDKVYWSEEMYRIFGLDSQEFHPTYNSFFNYVHPDDLACLDNALRRALNGGRPGPVDYRIVMADGKQRTVHSQAEAIFNEKQIPVQIRGTVQDITEKKEAEEAFLNAVTARKKEIHHRIKNNLQVISSLLDLQAEKFKNRESVEDFEVLDAFRESQDRVVSIALIHEELYEGEGADNLNFSQYLQRLVENLFQTYRFGNPDISLKMDLEENVFFDMDIAVPLGMIVNELVSNSLKHAFPGGKTGEVRIKLSREENRKCENGRVEGKNQKCRSRYTLTVSDNGVGIPENMDLENTDTLGTQLVTALVDQVDGELELRRGSGTEFIIKLAVVENQ